MFCYTRTSNVDLGALFWVAAGLVVFARYLRDGLTVRRALWLGIFAALATATKDPSYAAFLPLGIALVVRELLRLRRERGSATILWKSVLVGAGAGACAYLVLTKRRHLSPGPLPGAPQIRNVWNSDPWLRLPGLLCDSRHLGRILEPDR
jgi:hypothetical protein